MITVETSAFLVALAALLLAALVTIYYVAAIRLPRLQKARETRSIFGVSPRELTASVAEKAIKSLAWEAGSLMLFQEVQGEQIDPKILSTSAQLAVEVVERQSRSTMNWNLSAQGAVAKARLRHADELARERGVYVLPLARKEGAISVTLLPPYEEAKSAREETRRSAKTRR